MHSAHHRPSRAHLGAAPALPSTSPNGSPACLRPLLVSVEQASALLGIGRTTLYELINGGEISPIRIGRSVRFVLKELEEFVAARQAARLVTPPASGAREATGL